MAAMAAFALTGYRFLNNDASHDIVPGSEKTYDSKLPAGSSAKEIVSSTHFTSLVVEIQAVKGLRLRKNRSICSEWHPNRRFTKDQIPALDPDREKELNQL